VLPHVDLKQRDDAQRYVGLLVVELEGEQPVAEAVVTEYCPAGTLQTVGSGGELRAELVEGAECVIDRGGQIAGRLVASVGGEVLPPDRMVDVTAEVEASSSLARAALAPAT
jgi:hypothetical protein